MARFYFLILFYVFAIFSSYAQEHSKLTVGLGYPIILNGSVGDSHSSYTMGPGNINVYIEKPAIYLFPKEKNLFFTPGLAYFQFEESGEGGGLGGGSSKEVKHSAYSLYLKCLYKTEFDNTSHSKYYFGCNIGAYLYSRTTGTRKWWSVEENGNGSTEIDKKGIEFFNSLYMGFIFGFEPSIKKDSAIKPIIELAFYPNYAIFYDPHNGYEEQNYTKNMLEISVAIGLGNKKKRNLNKKF